MPDPSVGDTVSCCSQSANTAEGQVASLRVILSDGTVVAPLSSEVLDEIEAQNSLEIQMLSLLIGRRRHRIQRLDAGSFPSVDFAIRPRAA